MGEIRFLGLIEIVQKPAQGHGRRRIAPGQSLEGLVPELAADVLFRLVELEPPLPVFHTAVEFVPQDGNQLFVIGGALVHHRLRRGKAAQLIDDMLRPLLPGKGREMGLAGGDVAERHACAPLIQIDAAEEVAGLVLQTGGIDYRAGRHHPDDVPLHQSLGGGRVLHLLADGHLVPLGNEPGDVRFAGVVRDAAHGDLLLGGLFGVLVPGGQRQIQLFGSKLRIIGKHFVKVAQPEKQNGIRVVLFDLQVLLHHGGQFCQGCHLIVFLCFAVRADRSSGPHGAFVKEPRRRGPRYCCR